MTETQNLETTAPKDTSLDNSDVRRFSSVCLVLAVVFFLINVYRHWTYLEDDPLIVFRYALNFHVGHGWVMNAGEHVNGCTSPFGLLLVTILSKYLALDPAIIVLKVFGILIGPLVLWKSQQFARIMLPDAPLFAALAPLLIAYRTDFSIAMTNGMETPYACIFFLCALTALYKAQSSNKSTDQWISMMCFALAGLSRPELTIIYPGILALKFWKKEKIDFKLLAVYIVPFALLGAFNLTFYHSVVPNTYFAKLVNLPTGLVEGGEYIAQYLLAPVAFISGILSLLCLLAVASRPNRSTEIFLVTVGLNLLFLLRTSGDWMVDGRLAMPILPLIVTSWLIGLYVASKKVSELLHGNRQQMILAGVLATIVLAVGAFYDNKQREAYIHQCSRIRSFGDTLQTAEPLSTWMCGAPDGRRKISNWLALHAKPGETAAMPEMGLIPCLHPELNFIDVEGLTDASIAKMPYPHGPYGAYAGPYWDDLHGAMGQYIEKRHPEYVISAFSHGPVILNPNYVRVAGIVTYVDNTGKVRFIVYKRKTQ